MNIGGFQACSLTDYPGKVTAIVFTLGCNFRCPYCHNPELVDETAPEIDAQNILEFLRRRQGKLDAVTITGGEPTLHGDLPQFVHALKKLGFLVKLDTNGTNPSMLSALMDEGLLDYIAMDIKAPLGEYARIVGRPINEEKIRASIKHIRDSHVPYEFRTTVVKSLLSKDDIQVIGEDIRGARMYYLQKFVPTKILNPAFLRKTTYTDEEFEDMRNRLLSYVAECRIR